MLDALDRKGLARDTLVLFTSANGGVIALNQAREETDAYRAGLRPNGPFRDGKVSVYEGAFRVPLLVRWPGRVPAGTTCGEMTSVVDVIAAIIGDPLPSPSQAAEDSYDMRPAWLGEPHPAPLRPDMILHSCDGNFAIRQGPWQYIEGTPHPTAPPRVQKARAREFRPQLYNLADDSREQHDLLERHPDVAGRLRALLEKQRRDGSTRPVAGE